MVHMIRISQGSENDQCGVLNAAYTLGNFFNHLYGSRTHPSLQMQWVLHQRWMPTPVTRKKQSVSGVEYASILYRDFFTYAGACFGWWISLKALT